LIAEEASWTGALTGILGNELGGRLQSESARTWTGAVLREARRSDWVAEGFHRAQGGESQNRAE